MSARMAIACRPATSPAMFTTWRRILASLEKRDEWVDGMPKPPSFAISGWLNQRGGFLGVEYGGRHVMVQVSTFGVSPDLLQTHAPR